jgi:hypothetical protein
LRGAGAGVRGEVSRQDVWQGYATWRRVIEPRPHTFTMVVGAGLKTADSVPAFVIHSPRRCPMKPTTSMLVGSIALAFVALPALAAHDDSGHHGQSDHSGHHGHSDYSGHHGYRNNPYDSHRHYDHYKYDGHNYAYSGHWRSWNDWNAYYSMHPQMHRYGGYYHEHDHLMFRFCDPGSGTCFFFSIGQ